MTLYIKRDFLNKQSVGVVRIKIDWITSITLYYIIIMLAASIRDTAVKSCRNCKTLKSLNLEIFEQILSVFLELERIKKMETSYLEARIFI